MSNSNGSASTAARITAIVSEVRGVLSEIDQLLSLAGLDGSLAMHQIEQLTTLFGSLVQVALRALSDPLAREITPEMVASLLPASTPLSPPLD